MYKCILCGYGEVTFDDCVVTTKKGSCICLRCYLKNVDRIKIMPTHLQTELKYTVNSVK